MLQSNEWHLEAKGGKETRVVLNVVEKGNLSVEAFQRNPCLLKPSGNQENENTAGQETLRGSKSPPREAFPTLIPNCAQHISQSYPYQSYFPSPIGSAINFPVSENTLEPSFFFHVSPNYFLRELPSVMGVLTYWCLYLVPQHSLL